MTGPLRPGKGGLLLAVRVTPKASRDQVTGLHAAAGGALALAVKVTAPPDKGKANQAVLALLAHWADIPKSTLSIAAGETDRHKTILVTGNAARLAALIATLRETMESNHGQDH